MNASRSAVVIRCSTSSAASSMVLIAATSFGSPLRAYSSSLPAASASSVVCSESKTKNCCSRAGENRSAIHIALSSVEVQTAKYNGSEVAPEQAAGNRDDPSHQHRPDSVAVQRTRIGDRTDADHRAGRRFGRAQRSARCCGGEYRTGGGQLKREPVQRPDDEQLAGNGARDANASDSHAQRECSD